MSTTLRHLAGLRTRLGVEGSIWLLGLGVAVAAAALYTGVVADLPHEPSAREVPWWILAAAFAAAEMWVVHFHFRRSSHSFSLGELPLVFGLLFLSPHELLLASVLGSAVPLILDREIPPVKVFFNVAQFTLGTCVALAVFELLAVSRDALDPERLVGHPARGVRHRAGRRRDHRRRDPARRGRREAAHPHGDARHQLGRGLGERLSRAGGAPPSTR